MVVLVVWCIKSYISGSVSVLRGWVVSRCVNVCYLCWILVYGRKRCLLYIVLNIDMNLMDRKYYDFLL